MTSVGPGRLALWWVLGAGALAAMVVVALGMPRVGGNLLGGALAVAAALRLVAPDGAAGGLAVRPRALDVLIYAGLATVVLVGVNAVNWAPPR